MLLAAIVWLNKRTEKTTQPQTSIPKGTNAPVVAQTTNAQNSGQTTRPDTVPNTNDGAPVTPKSKEQQTLEILSTENDVPIVFYGKLEDQFGNPVAAAEVTGNTIIYNGLTEGGARFTTTSDSNGFFKLDCGKGESLGVVPHKAGYAIASTNGGGFYTHLRSENERQHPDPNTPVIIKMWKLQGAEPLLKINQRFQIPFTEYPLHFDLLTGKSTPVGGDLTLSITRSPGIVSERLMQDWGVTVEPVDGGIMDSAGTERITYWAPEEGYQEKETFIFSTNAPYKWVGGFTHGFYVKSRNGQVYAKITLSFSINQNPGEPMDVSLSGVANTYGSRNWEGDSNTYKP